MRHHEGIINKKKFYPCKRLTSYEKMRRFVEDLSSYGDRKNKGLFAGANRAVILSEYKKSNYIYFFSSCLMFFSASLLSFTVA